MQTIVGVRFKSAGKIYSFGKGSLTIAEGDHVIVETARGMECGKVVVAPREVPDESVPPNLRTVHRIADASDLARIEENRAREREACTVCEEKIRELGLKMKLVDVELTFDLSKMLFYFTADGRVDFRQLVRELAGVFRTRIELRQIGVRDEAKMMGGMGCCGRPLCCATFLGDFVPVSIRMAKEQNLSLNPTKISGICGRLMCCLKYESDGYGCGGCMRMKKAEYTPAQNDRVIAEDAEGRIVAVSEQRRTATILMDDGKTVIAAWEDIARVEGEDGEPRSHVPHEGRPRTPRERVPREGRERRERPAGAKPRERGERSERGERREQGERAERPSKSAGERRRPQGRRRQNRAPHPQQGEASDE